MGTGEHQSGAASQDTPTSQTGDEQQSGHALLRRSCALTLAGSSRAHVAHERFRSKSPDLTRQYSRVWSPASTSNSKRSELQRAQMPECGFAAHWLGVGTAACPVSRR